MIWSALLSRNGESGQRRQPHRLVQRRRQDSLDGGLNIDTCQGPAPDPDTHASCENTLSPPITGPGSSTSNAGELCTRSGGLFVDLSPVDYSCVFITTPIKKQRRAEAGRICTQGGGTFRNVTSLLYTCVLP